MNRFAATLMALACLLYVGMPAWSVPAKAAPVAAVAMSHDHGDHAVAKNMAGTGHANHSGKSAKPCPHGAEGCVTPFCAACLVVLPDLAFQPLSRIGFSYPAPEPARALLPHGPDLNLPPPRA
jgi:hypothetical protein